MLYHPSDESHSDTFGNQGGHLFSLEIPSGWRTKAKDYELQMDERIVISSSHANTLMLRAYRSAVSEIPAIWPRSFFCDQAIALFGPPSVPTS